MPADYLAGGRANWRSSAVSLERRLAIFASGFNGTVQTSPEMDETAVTRGGPNALTVLQSIQDAFQATTVAMSDDTKDLGSK